MCISSSGATVPKHQILKLKFSGSSRSLHGDGQEAVINKNKGIRRLEVVGNPSASLESIDMSLQVSKIF